MFNDKLTNAVEEFASIMLPFSEADLSRPWAWKDHNEEGLRFAFFVTIQELRRLAIILASSRRNLTQTQSILGQYHAQYMDLQASILGLSSEAAKRAPARGEWPVQRVYAHILGGELNFSIAVRYALEQHRAGTWTPEKISDEDELRLLGMSEDEYTALMRGSIEDMLAYHQELHPKILRECSDITDNELDLPSTFWEETRFPIRHRLHRFEAHIVQHTVQIDKTLAALGLAPTESKRLVRYLYRGLAEAESMLIGTEADDYGAVCSDLATSITERTHEIRRILEQE